MLFKSGENRFIFAETINIFAESKMAAAAILNFGKFAFLTRGSILFSARYTLFKFGENRFIFAEIINIFAKSKMAAAAILDFRKFANLT